MLKRSNFRLPRVQVPTETLGPGHPCGWLAVTFCYVYLRISFYAGLFEPFPSEPRRAGLCAAARNGRDDERGGVRGGAHHFLADFVRGMG